jgi:uncharacterized protein (TIGR02271 family)
MMEKAIVGVFDEQYDAQQAREALLSEGFSSDNVRLSSAESSETTSSTHESSSQGESIGQKIGKMFGFGKDDDTYSEAVRRGNYVLVADVADEQQAERAQVIIEQHNPVDIDERAEQWRQSGWQSSRTETQTTDYNVTRGNGGEEVVPVVEEELRVSKRQTQRGGVRVRSHNYEKPVEANVELHEEHGTVERRPVNRPATETDVANAEASVEVRDTAEEAVVAKDARVVEEVVVGKEASNRTETISDSVRRTEVDVEDVDGEKGKTAATRNSKKPSRR